MLNTVNLDGEVTIKKGSGGGGTPGGGGGGGTTPSGSQWTGHADAKGLKAIGWTDEDIAYYQQNGVNWNEEDDDFHKVTDDNKALYGILSVHNIQTYKERIVYLPKIDISTLTSCASLFANCTSLISVPMLDTAKVTNMQSMFNTCLALTCVPLFNTENVTDMTSMFQTCVSLKHVPLFDTSKVKSMTSMFNTCYALSCVPDFNCDSLIQCSTMFNACHSLVRVPPLDLSKVDSSTKMANMFASCHALIGISQLINYRSQLSGCNSLIHAYFKGQQQSISFAYSPNISKESILYIINNELATSAITITLASYAYNRLSTDPDIVAALANHPNISISK
jgi:surface protein